VNIFQLAWRNIQNNAFRSTVLSIFIMVIAGMLTFAMLIVHGINESLRFGTDRLGADILVLPEGTEGKVQSALFMGATVDAWMPRKNVERIRDFPGVKMASPQLYLASLANAPCCSSEMFIMVFEPETDFTVTPWLEGNLDHPLGFEEAIGGSNVFVPYGEEKIRIYGTDIDLLANMEPTGTGLDATLFLTFDTAFAVAEESYARAIKPLEIPDQSVSAILIKVEQGIDARIMALQIMDEIPGVTAIPSQDLFLAFRERGERLRQVLLVLLVVTSGLSFSLIGLVFSMGISQRKKEIGVLRALGAKRQTVLKYLFVEAALLASGGGVSGIELTCFGIYLFRNLIIASLDVTFLFPSWSLLFTLASLGLIVVLSGIFLAVLYPVVRISRLEPNQAMQE
jgi:putative ABC transport system permease protein